MGESEESQGGSCTVPWQREPPPCTHPSLHQLRDSCGLPFTTQNAPHGKIQFLGGPQCHPTELPWFGGRVTLPRGETLPPATEAESQPGPGAAPQPTPIPPGAHRSGAGRRGRKLLAAACRAQEGPARLSPFSPQPGGSHRGGCSAGLTDSRRSAQSPAPTGHRALPSTSNTPGAFEGLRSSVMESNPAPKPTAQLGPRTAGVAQPGRGHCCSLNGSLHSGRDKDGHGDGEQAPLTSWVISPALPPAPSSPSPAPIEGKPTLAPQARHWFPGTNPQVELLHVLLNHEGQAQDRTCCQDWVLRRAPLCSADPRAGSGLPSLCRLRVRSLLSHLPGSNTNQQKYILGSAGVSRCLEESPAERAVGELWGTPQRGREATPISSVFNMLGLVWAWVISI